MSIIGLKDLRQNMDTYIRRIKKGDSFIVVKKSQPVFKITPLEQEENWETVVDFTKIKKGGVDIDEVLKYL
ncbi:MAG: type II toxin-antitoxin system prevent-host-death family antitoxin [bacterium]|nr:type II toxin-antitoxin system prevent-host-death family antitoxin [bacterium]